MINGHDFYMVLSAMMPLYFAMTLAYGSVRWWKIFTPDQCAGINRFVAVFAIPFLCFNLISKNNPYEMNLKFIAADTLQKIIVLAALIFWASFAKRGSLDWLITFFSLSTMPNTLIIGVPLLVAMYGEYCKSLMVQIVVMQCIIWYTVLLFLLEFRAAKRLIAEQFPDAGGSIVSLKVDSDVISLDGNEFLETETVVGGDGKLSVTVRKSNASLSRRSFGIGEGLDSTQRTSHFSEVDISNSADFLAISRARSHPKRHSSFSERTAAQLGKVRMVELLQSHSKSTGNANELQMLAWGSNEAPTAGTAVRNASINEVRLSVSDNVPARESKVNPETQDEPTECATTMSATGHAGMPPTSVMVKLILVMVWRKLIRNPNTYSSLIGLTWSLIQFRWRIGTPIMIDKSVTILSDVGLGMAMFTLGLFMALQPSLIPCGKGWAAYSTMVRFIIGPGVMAVASLILGIRGDLLNVAIVQAALPQALVTFVFAKEYNVHPQILSTSVVFGMMIAIPVTLIYYVILEL